MRITLDGDGRGTVYGSSLYNARKYSRGWGDGDSGSYGFTIGTGRGAGVLSLGSRW